MEADVMFQSIREFCALDTPIFMFDKDGAFVVMKLEEVCYAHLVWWGYTNMRKLLPLSFGPEQLPAPGTNKLQ